MANIVETAMKAGSFGTLVAALDAAELVDTLSEGGPFTVFAPNDDAFAKLPEGAIKSLLEDKPALTNILTYHVARGKLMAADVADLPSLETLQGQSLTIDTEDGVRIDAAKVIRPDIEAENGVIHVIDTVVMPA